MIQIHASSFLFMRHSSFTIILNLIINGRSAVHCESADPGVMILIPAIFHTFMEIDHEIISTVILFLPLIQEGLLTSYKRKYVQEVLVNCLVKLAQEKVWLGELTVST